MPLQDDESAKFVKNQIQENCPHCSPHSFALSALLFETSNFRVVCDVHPIVEGHILIIPKKHFSCSGEFPKDIFEEFLGLYKKVSKFLEAEYGMVSSFEHGKIGQTVFHAHVHLMPFKGEAASIVPEGKGKLVKIRDLAILRDIFKKNGQYLFFSIGSSRWLVANDLGTPRFFRDRFAKALGRPERGNWKLMEENKKIMDEANKDIENLRKRWKAARKI